MILGYTPWEFASVILGALVILSIGGGFYRVGVDVGRERERNDMRREGRG
jgi:hypothetical protein